MGLFRKILKRIVSGWKKSGFLVSGAFIGVNLGNENPGKSLKLVSFVSLGN